MSISNGDRSIQERVFDAICQVLAVDRGSITLSTSFKDDLNADSMDLVTLAITLEDEFAGTIEQESVGLFKTVGDVVRFITDQLAPEPA